MADKLDTLRDCFRVGLIPTGSKDPFALRRAAQGVVKILFEGRAASDLRCFAGGIRSCKNSSSNASAIISGKCAAIAYDEVNAVLAAKVGTLPDLAERTDAVHQVRPNERFRAAGRKFQTHQEYPQPSPG